LEALRMIEDVLKSARDQIAERLASPLIGSFVVSWCLWNYKFLVILFSSASVSQTFRLIESLVFPDVGAILLRGIILPLLTSFAYIFAYPYPAKFVDGFTRRRQKEILELRRAIENETPLTLEESRRLRAEMLEAEEKHRGELDRMAQELARAREELEKFKPEPPSPSPRLMPPPRVPPVLEPSQRELLRLLEKLGGKTPHGALMEKSGLPKVRAEFDIGELERLKLVQKEYDQGVRDYVYEFTHEGRRMVLSSSKSTSEPGAHVEKRSELG
jgi:predicted DNA-binding transcriptional regulator